MKLYCNSNLDYYARTMWYIGNSFRKFFSFASLFHSCITASNIVYKKCVKKIRKVCIYMTESLYDKSEKFDPQKVKKTVKTAASLRNGFQR